MEDPVCAGSFAFQSKRVLNCDMLCHTVPKTNEGEMDLLRDIEAADYLGVSVRTVWRWSREIPDFPTPVRLTPHTPRWRKSDLQAYIEKQAAQ